MKKQAGKQGSLNDFFAKKPETKPEPDAKKLKPETDIPWVRVKEERVASLADISRLSAAEFDAQWGHKLHELQQFRPSSGYINKAANVVCTKSGRICKFQKITGKSSTVWENVGDISVASNTPHLVFCSLDFSEVHCHHV